MENLFTVFNIYSAATRNWIINHTKNFRAFSKNLKLDYLYLRGFHATKIYDFDDFSNGLWPANEAIIKTRARQLFLHQNKEHDGIKEKIIADFRLQNEGELHYCINKESFSDCYQYLLFGSEDLMRMADAVKMTIPSFAGRRILVDTGTSVIIHLNIPIRNMDKNEMKKIFECLCKYEIKFIHKCEVMESFIHRKEAVPIEKIEKVKNVVNKYGMPEY